MRWTTVSKIILLVRCEHERIYQYKVSNQEPTSEFLVRIKFLTINALGSIRIYSLKSVWVVLSFSSTVLHTSQLGLP